MARHGRAPSCKPPPLQLARAIVLVRHGEANPLLSSRNHAFSLAEDDLGQKPIDMTSLVTRIERYVGVMETAEGTFMPETEAFRYEVGLEHFVQGHMMREGPRNSIFMCYLGYDREIELPRSRLSLSTR